MSQTLTTERLHYPPEDLNLLHTLTCGQAFRWRLDDEGWWTAPVQAKVMRIRQADDGFLWQTLPGRPDQELLARYFRLDTDVASTYEHLAKRDSHLAELVVRLRGLRLLRQDPEEALFSFVCSTANSVPRIAAAVEAISEKHGRLIAEVGGRRCFSFPSAAVLASADPHELAAMAGLNWRGANIVTVARQIVMRQRGWLESLRSRPYLEARAGLLELRAVGAKIADCVCLFALDKDEAVPVDTHVRQVAARYYTPDLRAKTITPAVYDRIVQVFREKFGAYAGWAQQFLYYEDLRRSRTCRPQAGVS